VECVLTFSTPMFLPLFSTPVFVSFCPFMTANFLPV
jgi:hypothetical protein